MHSTVLDFLLERRSAPIHELEGPEPSSQEIESMLKAATRVPDHGKLTPWRFILYRGEHRAAVGEKLAKRAEELEGALPEGRLEKERTRFSRAPLVIGVISVPRENTTIPEWEMFLSGGMAAMNLMLAANAMGFGTNLITNWYSDDAEARALLGLQPRERVVGFVHIGRHGGGVPDRPRPAVEDLVSDYSGPWEG